jgi:hypothetical protein
MLSTAGARNPREAAFKGDARARTSGLKVEKFTRQFLPKIPGWT